VSARLIVADVFDGLRSLPDGSVDFACWSPPFLALRSYLPADHPDKGKEIGSEATPAAWLDVMLAVTAEVGRVLAPHGSIAVEIGDTYAGSGGAGGDYLAEGWRSGEPKFNGSAKAARWGMDPEAEGKGRGKQARPEGTSGPGWPLSKSLTGLPTLFAWSLAYGRNLLTGEPSLAGQWRVRNLRPWVRPNPPVGSLGDKVRPATSYVTVACRSERRWHDLDAVRRATSAPEKPGGRPRRQTSPRPNGSGDGDPRYDDVPIMSNPAGAPPLDWQHPVDEVLRAQLATDRTTPRDLRLALERAGWLASADTYDLPPGGYTGAHYAVWPPALVAPMVEEMCPRRVCRTCGGPSRRLTGGATLDAYRASDRPQTRRAVELADAAGLTDDHIAAVRATGPNDTGKALVVNNGAGKNSDAVKSLAAEAKAVLGGYFREFVTTGNATSTTTGWSSCGCPGTDGIRVDGFHTGPAWRPGVVLDPFAGTGTTLRVAVDRGRDAVGVDIDARNADLAGERLGMFLDVEIPVSSEVQEGEVA
jgi:hypothetical protein